MDPSFPPQNFQHLQEIGSSSILRQAPVTHNQNLQNVNDESQSCRSKPIVSIFRLENRKKLQASQERPPTPPVTGVDPEQGNGERKNPSILDEPNLEHKPSLDGAPTTKTIGTLPR